MELPANPKNILQGVYNKRGQRVDLDEEALDCAIGVLMQLKNTGRMIGIISHVSELKDRIKDKLIVSATQNGSYAHFLLS